MHGKFVQEPILRLLNSQLGTTPAFFIVKENIFVFITLLANRGVVNFYSTGDRRIGSRALSVLRTELDAF
jgi:hypothetical protein